MAVAPTKSVSVTNDTASPSVLNEAHGALQMLEDIVTFTTGGTGTIKMRKMPAGKIRVYPDLCRVICPIGTATSDLHIGHAAYSKLDGTTGSADDNAFHDNADVGGGALDEAWTLPANGRYEIESASGWDLEVMFDTADSPASGDMYTRIVFQHLGG